MTVITLDAGNRGRETMKARANLHTDLVKGQTHWQDIVRDPPECVHGMLLVELLLLLPGVGRRRVETLGRRAFFDGLVLTGRCERTSELTRYWVCRNLQPYGSSGARARHRVAAKRVAWLS